MDVLNTMHNTRKTLTRDHVVTQMQQFFVTYFALWNPKISIHVENKGRQTYPFPPSTKIIEQTKRADNGAAKVKLDALHRYRCLLSRPHNVLLRLNPDDHYKAPLLHYDQPKGELREF